MKRMLLFAMSLLMGTFIANAQVYIETDRTSDFSSLTLNTTWGGGYTGTDFCPMVEVNGLGPEQVVEKYAGSTSGTGVVMSATVNGLTAGTYKIELYGGAAFTYGRGFSSTLFGPANTPTTNPETEVDWVAGEAYTPEMAQEYGDDEVYPTTTGVELYAVSEGVEYGGQIPVYYAQKFPDGASVVTLSGIEVGESGAIQIGIRKTAENTNWHVVQLKSVIAQVNAADLLAAVVAKAEAVDATAISEDLYNELTETVNIYNQEWETAEEYTAAIDAIQAVLDRIDVAISAKPILDAMKALVDATNVYTEDAYYEYYGQWAAKYEEGTLTAAEVSGLQNPTTLTDWHANITCDDFLLSAWDAVAGAWSGYYINTWSTEGNSDGSEFRVPFFEYWTGDGNSLGEKTLTATMNDLEPGYYKATAWVRVRMKNGSSDPYGITFQVNDGIETNVCNGTQIGSSQFYLIDAAAIGTVDESGVLEIKFNVAADNNISWLSFKNVNFEETDEDPLDFFKAQVTALKEEIQALYGTIPSAVFSHLSDQASVYEDEYSTLEDYQFAIENLTNILAEGKAIQPIYVQASLAIANAKEIKDTPYTYTGEDDPNPGLAYVVAQAESDLNNAESADGLETIISQVKEVVEAYAIVATPTDDNVFDLTSIYLVNPDVTDYWDGTWYIVPDGWYTDQTGNFQVMANEEMGPGGEVFIEYWSESPQANGQFNLYQNVTLPVGTYKMTGRLGAQQPTGGETSGIFFAANDVLGTNIPKGPLTDAELEFVNTEEQEVKIGMKAMTGNCLRWVGINKMRLFKLYTRPTLDFSEDSYLNVMSDISSADVHLSLATKAGEWMPVVLPFSVTLDQLKEFGGEGTEIVVLDTQYEDAIIFSPAESTQANVPFIIKTAKDVTSWTFEGCNVIKEDNPAQNGLFFNFIGNYTNGTAIPNNGYIYEEGEWKFGSGITFKAFHAYITYNTAQGAQVLPDVTFDGLDPKRIDAEELAVLSEVYENANGTDWNEKWQLDATPVTARNLPGITVSDGKVKGVSLASNNMEGEFPELLLTLQSVESIDISGNSLTGSLGSIETESPVKVLNISGNNFDGNIGQFVVNLNSLETLIASNNKITEVNPMISPNVTNLDLSSQKMDLVAELDLANLAEETLMASLPSILFYDHESQAYLPNVTLNCSDGDDFKYSMVYEDGSLGMNLISSNNVYKALNDDILDVATPGGDTFKIHISYPMGDSNFNGCFDVADLMTTINFIFEEYKTKPFNFVAANFNNDDIINVQDVVLTVDGLLAQEQEEVGGEAPRRIQGEVATAEAMIFWRGNDLVLNTSVPVSALDINVESEGNIDWMFKSAGLTFKTRTNENRHHVVAYSMSGATLPVGETVIARVSSTADIINVVACDKAAQYVNVVISNDDTTGIESITAESENNGIYDLTGRKLQRANVKAGIYIIDGKKMIIR